MREGAVVAPRATLSEDGCAVVRASEAGELLELHHKSEYGELRGGVLALDPLEAAFLLERGKLELYAEGRRLSLPEAIAKFSEREEDFWVKFTVYSDLRKRGFIVKRGFSGGIDLVMKRRGSKAMEFAVSIVREGERVDFRDLSERLERALRMGKELVISIVDREGNVSYYTLSKIF